MLNKINPVHFVVLMVGILLGTVIYTFIYAKGWSYLSDDPKACINCHVMNEQFDSWSKSTHHHVTKCNDCHLPHNIVGKYAVKALNGFNHSLAFTMQNFPDVIKAKKHSVDVVKSSCLNCHEAMTQNMRGHDNLNNNSDDKSCLNCHRSVGHAR